MNATEALLERLPPFVLVAGKGGVGKTTCAGALAATFAARGEASLLVSTDPAGTLGDAVGVALDNDPRAVPEVPGLFARQLSAADERVAFLERWRGVIVTIVDRGTYLDTDDIGGLVDAALPGGDEVFALLALAGQARDPRWQRIVVDTAPTGHTLRLLSLPDTFDALLRLLERMQEKHRFMVKALTHRYRGDAADAFLDDMRRQLADFAALLHDPARAATVLVTRAEPVVIAETERFAEALTTTGPAVQAVIVNTFEDTAAQLTARIAEVVPNAVHVALPRLESPPRGIAQLQHLLAKATVVTAPRAARPAPRAPLAPPASRLVPRTLLRPLTIAGGKGGVGKTTVACALAIASADAGSRTLLVSTDPAPSIADALAQPVGDEETAVPSAPGLVVRQLDAAAAFGRFRDRYQERIDAVFSSFVAGGADLTHDRAIMRDLMALAPPGVDELFALSYLADTLDAATYDTIVVDPAPTGHLLRLLEMPELALDWSHRLMRLMLKYKEVAGLGEVAGEVLAFAKQTRSVRALLSDPARSGVVLVALDEPLVRGETLRLAQALAALGVARVAVVWNRGDVGVSPLPTDPPLRQLVARFADPAPVGVEALRAWSRDWRELPAIDA